MHIVNSPVAPANPDFIFGGSCLGPKAVAEAKQIARKRDRARLREWTNSMLRGYALEQIEEEKEKARVERESAYQDLMARLNRSSRKHVKRARRTTAAAFFIPPSQDRVTITMQRVNATGERELAVLASCACD